MGITSVSAVQSLGSFCLNRADSGFGLFVLGVIVPIPTHTPNIIRHSTHIKIYMNIFEVFVANEKFILF